MTKSAQIRPVGGAQMGTAPSHRGQRHQADRPVILDRTPIPYKPASTRCEGTTAKGNRCNAKQAYDTSYCVGHLRSLDPERYERERASRGDSD